MSFFGRILKLRGLNQEIDEELRFHINEKERRFVADGLTPAAARREARKAFGSQAAVREYTRDAWVYRWADDLWRDLRLAARGLRRSPGFTAVAVVTLALGIGGCAAMYAFVEQLIVLDQPYPDRASLVVVEEVNPQTSQSTAGIHPDALLSLQNRSDSFRGIGGYNTDGFALKTNDDVRILDGALVTPNIFNVLDVRPLLGRVLAPGSADEVVLGELAWKRYFSGTAQAVGSAVELNGRTFNIVGVMPKEFWRGRDLWLPLSRTPQEAGRLRTWARLKDGIRPQTAQAELDALTAALALDRNTEPRRLALRDPFALPGGQRSMLAASAVAPVAFLFLIVCVNVIHLQLGRDLQRGREMALCRALGAGRLRLIRRLLAESLVLTALGGVGGVAVAWWGVKAIALYLPAELTASIERLELDAGVLGFLLLLSAATTMAIGIAPALRASGVNLTAALKQGGRGQTASNTFRGVLATSELALSMTLLAGAGMMGLLTQRVAETDMGFDAERLWTARLSLRGPLAGDETRRAWAESALREVRALPGVASAAVATEVPLRGGHVRRFEANGLTAGEAEFRSVSASYFETMRAPLLLGRAFGEGDRQGSAPVVIVNETLVRRSFGGQALGRQIRIGGELREIVGVVADVRQNADARPAPATVYAPFSQAPDAPLSLVVRARPAAGATSREVLDRLGAPSGELIVLSVFDFEQALRNGARSRAFLPASMTLFAVLGLVLAGVGLYGTTSRAVAQRTQEFGVRQALGAGAGDILRLVMRESGRGGLAGMVIGLAGSFAAARLLLATLAPQERAAYGVDRLAAGDLALACTGASALLIAVVLLAAYVPARRATKIEPVTALRHD